MGKASKEKGKNYFYSYDMIFDHDLSYRAKLVYLYLCRCADTESKICYPSNKDISKKTGISVTAVKIGKVELLELGLIEKSYYFRENGSQTANTYEVFPEPQKTILKEPEIIPQMAKKEEVLSEKRKTKMETNKQKNKDKQSIESCQLGQNIDIPQPTVNRPSSPIKATPPTKCTHLEGILNISNTNKEVLPKGRNIHFEKMSVSQSTDSDPGIIDESNGLERIKEQCELHLVDVEKTRKMVENVLETMWYSEFLQIGNAKYPQAMVRSRMYQLHGAIIFYALDKIKFKTGNIEKITNSTRYLVSTIYNSINEYHSDAVVDPELNRMIGAESS